jgi:hypothetical protein
MSDNEEQENEAKVSQDLAERWKIRQNLKGTLENMEYLQTELADIKKGKFQAMNDSLNQTFEKIHHARELTLDVCGQKMLSHSLKSQALKLSDLSKQHNFEALCLKLKDFYSVINEKGQANTDHIDWTVLGFEVAHIKPITTSFTTMTGPFQKEEKTRKPITRRKATNEDEKNAPVEKPKEIIQTGDEDKNEATNERVKKLISVVRNLTDESNEHKSSSSPSAGGGGEIGFDLLSLLVDPVDDVQTIENFFDFSFLIKVSFFSFYFTCFMLII